MKFSVFLGLLLAIYSNLALAQSRSPAVLPTVILSIDSMKKINPVNAKGFNFEQPQSKIGSLSPARLKALQENGFKSLVGEPRPNLFLMLSLMLLPFGVWLSFLHLLKENDNSPSEIEEVNEVDNVIWATDLLRKDHPVEEIQEKKAS